MRMMLFIVTFTRADAVVDGHIVAPTVEAAMQFAADYHDEIGVTLSQTELQRIDESLPDDKHHGLDDMLEDAPIGFATQCEACLGQAWIDGEGWPLRSLRTGGAGLCRRRSGSGDRAFLLAAYEHMKGQTQDREKLRELRHKSFRGYDIVDEVVRLCAMNLYLHGVGNGGSPVEHADALAGDPGERFDILIANPPFGKKSSYRVVGEDGSVNTERENYEREDFKFTTSNKQLNFLQHIMTIMDANGRAGVVLPDNVLFEANRAGEGIRKRLLEGFNFHTLLRLPTGIWYSPGVKANVLFFDKRPASRDAQTKELWVYDYRTNVHKTLKTKRLSSADLDDFVQCYRDREETERFRRFTYEELIERDKLNLDIFWLKDDSLEDIDSLPEPDVLAQEIVENLEAALEHFRGVTDELAIAAE